KEFGALPLDAGITLSANCEPDKQPALLELKPGKHLLEVEVEVAGGPTLTLPPQEVMLSCQAKPAPGHGDAGANSTTTGGDCSFGRGAPGAPAALLALSGPAALFAAATSPSPRRPSPSWPPPSPWPSPRPSSASRNRPRG